MTIKKAPKTEGEIFQALAEKISTIIGVQLGEKQNSLVQSRLSKHLRSLGGMSAVQYWDYFHENEAEEVQALISLLTTHHTFFFREMEHFHHIAQILPKLIEKVKADGRKTIDVWSAACSHGHEGYSLAMFLEYHLGALRSDIGYRLLFSDVDSASVEASKQGVYDNKELAKVELNLRANCWTVGRGSAAGFTKIKSRVQANCEYVTKNLLEVRPDRNSRKFDLIFCRNVFIYFTPVQVQKICSGLIAHLHSHGELFVGSSENLVGLDIPLKHIGKSIYVREGESLSSAEKPKPAHVYSTPTAVPKPAEVQSSNDAPNYNCIIAIGASTGGTEALAKVLSQLPPNMPPIVIVQHIPAGFSRDFADRLNKVCSLTVREAEDGEKLSSGLVLVAPGDRHVEINGRSGFHRIVFGGSDKRSGHCPSIDVLFRSVSELRGIDTVGVIMTGMGADGAQGLLEMKRSGALTFGQNEKTSVVYGMPKVALQLGAVDKEVDLGDIARTIEDAVRQLSRKKTA